MYDRNTDGENLVRAMPEIATVAVLMVFAILFMIILILEAIRNGLAALALALGLLFLSVMPQEVEADLMVLLLMLTLLTFHSVEEVGTRYEYRPVYYHTGNGVAYILWNVIGAFFLGPLFLIIALVYMAIAIALVRMVFQVTTFLLMLSIGLMVSSVLTFLVFAI